jgi:tetratricopeptide (TPR) repeat protein
METTSFVPKLPNKIDTVSYGLLVLTRLCLVLAISLTPLIFFPGLPALLGASKTYAVLLLLCVSLVAIGLATLRSGAVTWRLSPILFSWWGIVVTALISSLFSPHLMSSLIGDTLETNTVGFLSILGVLMSLILTFAASKKSVVYLFGATTVVAVLIVLFHSIRVVVGVEQLTGGFLNSKTATVVGSFNDLGLFLALTVSLTLVAVVQLSLSRLALVLLGGLVALALVLLTIVNFSVIWLLLTLFSLMLLMYCLTKDRFGVAPGIVASYPTKISWGGVGIITLVFLTASVFLIGGSTLGTTVSNLSGISYVEIRPSMTATLDIMRNVYRENAITGAGPNQFAGTWQLYKDRSITETIFWETEFSAGNGYIPTWFITTGILGALAWLTFLGSFIYTGLQMLLRGHTSDQFWYFTGSVAFVAASFVWLLSILYVPGPAILIIGAASTGLMVVAHSALVPKRSHNFNLLTSARTGFLLITVVMVIVISSIAVGYGSVRQFTAAHTFVTAAENLPATPAAQISAVNTKLARAYALYPSDTYIREIAQNHILQLNQLLGKTDITAATQQEFQQAITAGILAGTAAVRNKPSEAQNWKVLGDLYAVLANVGNKDAGVRAQEAYTEAEVRDPRNPYYVLKKSALAYQRKEYSEARRLALLALELKSNYTDAFFTLSQIAVALGDVPNAITSTESLIALESNNPGRYYQLGVLQTAAKNQPAAIAAFTAAITLDPSYANARYFRALQYLEGGQTELALTELAIVRDLSPDNLAVNDLMGKITRGEITAAGFSASQPVTEPTAVRTDNETKTVAEAPENDFLKSVNTSPADKESRMETSTSTQSNSVSSPAISVEN